MPSSSFPTGFDPSRCVLFLGSGFSSEATNRKNGNPPAGDGLRKKILEEIGETNLEDDLKDISQYAHSRGYDLHKLLSDLFTIKVVGKNQEEILKHEWKRIYTTNYDDCVEVYDRGRERNKRRASFSVEDARPAKLPSGAVIHLHGYIHNCGPQNVLTQLVLDHRSYAEQAAIDSAWWEQFGRDLRGAQFIFFVGYSLSDFAAAKYLTKNPDYVMKTHFIVRAPVSVTTETRLSGYGSIHAISVEGFGKECALAVPGVPIQALSHLNAFRHFDPYKDNKSAQRPTPLEIDALLTKGKLNSQLLASNHSTAVYTVPRRRKIEEAIQKIKDSRTLILHSRTANGKSIFSDLLACELHAKGYTCVAYKGRSTVSKQEIDFLSTVGSLCVFVGAYDNALSISDELKSLPEATKFVVEINTGTDQIRRSEVQAGLPKPIARVGLNEIATEDVRGFEELLDTAGLASVQISKEYGIREMRELLLKIIASPVVIDRLNGMLVPLKENPSAKKVLATISVLKVLGVSVGFDFVKAVVKVDPYDALLDASPIASEFADFSEDELLPHSAIFSDFFLRQVVGGTGVSSVVCRLAIEAARRVNSADPVNSQRKREARRAMGSLIQFRNLDALFSDHVDREKLISDIYENLRENININKEPLFWLQYSIFMQSCGEFDIAVRHIDTAYQRASLIPGFLTYQLDTNHLKLLFHTPKNVEMSSDDIEAMFELIEKVREMIVAEDHRVHAFRVLEDLERFAANHGHALDSRQKQRLSLLALGVVGDLDGLPLSDQLEFGTNLTKESVERSVSLLATI